MLRWRVRRWWLNSDQSTIGSPEAVQREGFQLMDYAILRRQPRHALSMNRDQYRRTLVLDQHHDKLRRLRVAGIFADDMFIAWAFIKCLSRLQRHLLPTLHLHHNAALQHIDEGMSIVPVNRIGGTGRVLNQDHQAFAARRLRQVLGHELRNFGVFAGKRSRCKATKKNGQKSVSHAFGYRNCGANKMSRRPASRSGGPYM